MIRVRSSWPQILNLNSQELNLEAFGWNIPLGLLLPALRKRAEDLGVTFIEATATGARSSGDAIHITLSNTSEISASLCLAADGANSAMRKAAGIATDTWSYDQTAIATSFAHSMGHDNVSTEYHKSAGPFTTVPLPENRSSLVWMERPARAEALMAMSDRELAAEIQIETHGELGLISNLGPRKSFPMKGLTARQFAKDRVILIGEAAHVVPPIGAQGLNMSLRDAALAADLILASKDAGSDSLMAEYNALRRAEVLPRQQLIDLMNKSLLLGLLPLEGARAAQPCRAALFWAAETSCDATRVATKTQSAFCYARILSAPCLAPRLLAIRCHERDANRQVSDRPDCKAPAVFVPWRDI